MENISVLEFLPLKTLVDSQEVGKNNWLKPDHAKKTLPYLT